MILAAQLSWFLRAAAHRQLASYFTGLSEASRLASAMIRARARLRPHWRDARREFWQAIVRSESLARRDFASNKERSSSLFLKWYFRIF
jgi:hypothetical protein